MHTHITNSRWLQVAYGLRLKYWAMWVLLATPLIALLAHSLEIDVWWTTCSSLAVVLVIDSIGRVLCWMGQIIPSKSLLVSTAIQVSVILVALGFSSEVPRNPAMGTVLFLLLVLGQLLSAMTFTIYLRALAGYIHRPELTIASDRVMTSLVKGTFIAIVVVTIIPVVFVLSIFGAMFFWLLGYLFVLFLGGVVVAPLAIALLVVATRMLVNYGILLVQIRSELQAIPKLET